MTQLDQAIDTAIAAGHLPGLHAVVVRRGDDVLAERYAPGPDWRWGQSLGTVAHGPATRHDLRSVSKSLVALLYGIEFARRRVPPPEAPLLDLFPEYPDLAADPARRALTIDHALDMTLGLAWDETLPYTNPANSEIAMERAPDRYRFILAQPFAEPPGTRWRYCGGATALLGAIIARGTGRKLLDVARDALFTPLGITDAEWIAGSDGNEAAASGLRLRAPDLARLGAALLDGTSPVPAGWLARCLTPKILVEEAMHYGCHWYHWRGPGPAWSAAIGNGGQRLILLPERKIAIAILCGNYDRPEQRSTPLRLLREILFPALTRS